MTAMDRASSRSVAVESRMQPSPIVRTAASIGASACGARALVEVDADLPPLPLIEPQYAQRTARGMAHENGDPDIDGVERAHALDDEADPQRHGDLRDDGDVERALRVASSLQPAGVRERDCIEEP